MLHGGDLTEAMALFGGERSAWLDLSTGINPRAYPLPDLALRYWENLPTQGDLDQLLQAAQQAYRLSEGTGLVAAPGTQALIQWMAWLAPEGRTAILGPTYEEHARAFKNAGRIVDEIPQIGNWRGQANLVVVNPNNPDGRLLPPAMLKELAAEAGRRRGWLVIDESFIDTMPNASAVRLCTDYPVAILRSFGKFFGLAGIRLGFLIAAPEIVERFSTALGPWSVAGPTLAIGNIALRDIAWADTMRASLRDGSEALDQVLIRARCKIIGGTSLFRLARHPDAPSLHRHLARQRIWVRKFGRDQNLLRFGLPGLDGDLARLERALASFDVHASPQGVMTSPPSTA